MMSYNVLDLISSSIKSSNNVWQNVYFDVSIDNNPIGRITFKVNITRNFFRKKYNIFFVS